MLKNKRIMIITAGVFCLAEAVLFYFVQATSGEVWEAVAYASVVLAALFMLTSMSLERNYIFMQIGLALTVCADWFLVVEDPIKELVAMIFFSGTQICYFLRLYFSHETKKQGYIHLAVRLGVSISALVAVVIILKGAADALSLVSVFYYANLIMNVVFAFIQYKRSLIFPIGLLLFLACDTVVGLNALSDYVHIENASQLNSVLFGEINWAWIFYLPSQALLALSLTKLKDKSEKEN